MNEQTSTKKSFGLSSLSLKIIACILMTLDHIALLFLERGNVDINTDYYILRAVGKIAFPIFVFLAVEGVYHTKNIFKYLCRLGIIAIIMDGFGYIIGQIYKIPVYDNPLIGNAFTDLFLGVLAVYLLKRKDWYSLLAVVPVALAVLSNVTADVNYGTIIKTDWGLFSMVLFLAFFLARTLADLFIKDKAKQSQIDLETFRSLVSDKYHKYFEVVALVTVELAFYLLWRFNYSSQFLPNDFVPLGTYSTLAAVFLLFYNGKRGFKNKIIQYSFYAYYPFHIVLLGIISLFFGILRTAISA